jgi:hypothetical protein
LSRQSYRKPLATFASGVALLALTTVLAAACGSDGEGGATAPGPAKGSFVRVIGFLNKTFSIDPKDVNVKCIPRPGNKIFELTAGTPLAGQGLKVDFFDYQGSGDHKNLVYEPAGPQHLIRVTFPGPDKGYSFAWNQSLRSDTQEVLPSICDFSVKREEKAASELFTGTLVCSMLWAEPNTDGFDGTVFLNNFVDLFAKFECERSI